MEQINLNMIPGKVRPVCHVSQNDIGRVIRFNLFEGDEVFALASGDTVEVHVRKPNGETTAAGLAFSQGDNFVDVITAAEMTDTAGAALCEIQITRTGQTLGSLNFIMDIEEDPSVSSGPAPEPTPGAGLRSNDLNIQTVEYTSTPYSS